MLEDFVDSPHFTKQCCENQGESNAAKRVLCFENMRVMLKGYDGKLTHQSQGVDMHAMSQPLSVAISSSIDKGMMALPIIKVPAHMIRRNIG